MGIDIGGTFTDGVLLDEERGVVHIEKVPTTTHDLAEAFLQVFDAFSDRFGDPSQLSAVMHASTVATNALLERRGTDVGLVVTAGFRDLLEIGRQVRHELYNVFTSKPPAIVPRRHVREVRERLDRLGDVRTELSEADVLEAAEHFRRAGIGSVAICFLHSYLDSSHEDRAAELLREALPGAELSISSAIAPEIKEYWRASTTCINAYVGPLVRRYLARVVDQLAERSYSGPVGIMHSGGGVEGIEVISERPFQMIESGPAAGVAAAVHLARASNHRNAISFDMGGTTAKAGIIVDGVARVLSEFEVAASGLSGSSVAKASGYPV
ncbi:MAG TPA: hydantoinase/oxoprolinase family protein, partial [Acidimicrobiales bacterium]|nr:hydantoinase/oxoprolinase family protein [Acidimicrobiales bacterium]